MLLLLFWFLIVPTEGCNILALSGGGAHGAFQGGVINRLHDRGAKWDIITGISVGSLNGMALGLFNIKDQTKATNLIKHMWLNLTANDVYRWNWNPVGDQSLLDSNPLNKTIYSIAKKYGGVAKRDIIIGSTNLNTGLLELFNRNQFNSTERTTKIVMASSAIPVIFPPVYLDNNYYVDGGTYSNELIRPAIKYCLNKGHKRSEITIDIIICSAPIKFLPNKIIKADYIFGIISRSYDILSNVISNHEIYTQCNYNEDSYLMNIYKPLDPYPGGLLDFTHKDLVEIFHQGYNTTKPEQRKYCY